MRVLLKKSLFSVNYSTSEIKYDVHDTLKQKTANSYGKINISSKANFT